MLGRKALRDFKKNFGQFLSVFYSPHWQWPCTQPLRGMCCLRKRRGRSFTIHASAYLEAALFVLVVSMLVSFLFSKRIKKLDMVEVLKGVE